MLQEEDDETIKYTFSEEESSLTMSTSYKLSFQELKGHIRVVSE